MQFANPRRDARISVIGRYICPENVIFILWSGVDIYYQMNEIPNQRKLHLNKKS